MLTKRDVAQDLVSAWAKLTSATIEKAWDRYPTAQSSKRNSSPIITKKQTHPDTAIFDSGQIAMSINSKRHQFELAFRISVGCHDS
jgi:hypothetical protein